jgi:hypothetical protein
MTAGVIDDETFFIRGHIVLPIIESIETFAWSVWCSLSRNSFVDCQTRWNDPARNGDRYFGWLSTALPVYHDSTINIATNVVFREPGVVPMIQLHECDHPLYREQTNGITWDRVAEIAHELLHNSSTQT